MTKDSKAKTQEEARELDDFLEALFPINRSLTGEGNRQTLRLLQGIIPLEITEYPSGTSVYDWIIPDEWIIRDAFIKDARGKRLVDYRASNLHIVGYSAPVNQQMNFSELLPHLHYLESNPEAIPYRTCYYQRDWGFCVTETQYRQLEKTLGPLTVCIDSESKPDGTMTVGELQIPGKTDTEYLVSTYCCHPSMANDNLSGLLTTAFLARDLLKGSRPQCSWRFVIVPETIGTIAYLWHNEAVMKKLRGALVVTTCGGPGSLGYKESFLGDHLVDRAARLAFRDRGIDPVCYPFAPDGSDERQYSSPGFRIPAVSITKDKYYEYPQYHTSLDDLEFVNGAQIAQSLVLYRDVISILDRNVTYRSTTPFGEPQLGRRGLYPVTGGAVNQPSAGSSAQVPQDLDAITWLLFLADGNHDLLTTAEESGLVFDILTDAADRLIHAGLLQMVSS
jgi:aminopeptidase-like protein